MGKLSGAAYREYLRKKKLGGRNGNKYNAKKTRVAGEDREFPSQGEATAFIYFRELERAGKIKELTRYPSVRLTKASIAYKPDWSYIDLKTGEKRYVDFKGVETDRFKMIKKLWAYYGPGVLEIVKGKGFMVAEAIRPVKEGSVDE